MTILKNIPFINILKKRKKTYLYRSLFLKNQQVKRRFASFARHAKLARRIFQNSGRIKNKDYKGILFTKVKSMSALPFFSVDAFFKTRRRAFLEKKKKEKYGKRFKNRVTSLKIAIHKQTNKNSLKQHRLDVLPNPELFNLLSKPETLTRKVADIKHRYKWVGEDMDRINRPEDLKDINPNDSPVVGRTFPDGREIYSIFMLKTIQEKSAGRMSLAKISPIQRMVIDSKKAKPIPTLGTRDQIKIQNKNGYRIKVKKSKRLAVASTLREALGKSKKLSTKVEERKKKLFFRIKNSAQLFTTAKKRLVTSKQLLLSRKAEYRKYKKKIRIPKQKTPIRIPRGAKIGRISIKGTYNNIILTLTDKEGNTKAWASAGTAGFKNGRKSSHFAAESAADRLADRSIALGYTFARVKMKGLGGSKLKAIRRLCKSNLQLLGMSDNFSIAYNGCRRARKPRK